MTPSLTGGQVLFSLTGYVVVYTVIYATAVETGAAAAPNR
jgi:hypothetical protein